MIRFLIFINKQSPFKYVLIVLFACLGDNNDRKRYIEEKRILDFMYDCVEVVGILL
jgi:hypothetical protein